MSWFLVTSVLLAVQTLVLGPNSCSFNTQQPTNTNTAFVCTTPKLHHTQLDISFHFIFAVSSNSAIVFHHQDQPIRLREQRTRWALILLLITKKTPKKQTKKQNYSRLRRHKIDSVTEHKGASETDRGTRTFTVNQLTVHPAQSWRPDWSEVWSQFTEWFFLNI